MFLFVISSAYNESADRSIQYLSELKSVPVLSFKAPSIFPLHFIFLFSVFSMCGLPPLAGFFSKYFLMFEIMKGGSFSMVFFYFIGERFKCFLLFKIDISIGFLRNYKYARS